jgi:hypothetical protein
MAAVLQDRMVEDSAEGLCPEIAVFREQTCVAVG